MRITLLATAAACLLAAAPPASANSPELQAATIPASACQVEHAPGTVKPTLGRAQWILNRNGRALLLCPVPVRAVGAGLVLDRVRLLYLDPDGRGGQASVKLLSLVTDVMEPGTLPVTGGGCQFQSNIAGPNGFFGWYSPGVFCDPAVQIPPGSHLEIQIELWRRGPLSPAFAGLEFP